MTAATSLLKFLITIETGPDLEIPATLVFNYPRISDLAEFLVQTFEASKLNGTSQKELIPNLHSAEIDKYTVMRQQVEAMTEAEALGELKRELECD